MGDENEFNPTRKKTILRVISLSVFVILFGFFSLNFIKSYSMNRTLKRTHDSLLTVYSGLHQSNGELDSLMRALQYNDPEAIEWVARYQWHLARPGEKVYQLIPDGDIAEGK